MVFIKKYWYIILIIFLVICTTLGIIFLNRKWTNDKVGTENKTSISVVSDKQGLTEENKIDENKVETIENNTEQETTEQEPEITEVENQAVGTISIDKFRGDLTGTKYIILTVFVKIEKHHQGIGTMLIKKIEDYAKSIGVKELYIPASIYGCEFYRKLGYDYLNGKKELNEDKEYTLVKYL